MCYDDYLAEKLPINETKLPSLLQPDYNIIHAARSSYEYKSVPKHNTKYAEPLHDAANAANLSLREFKHCMQDLLFTDYRVFNELQLSLWFASHVDACTEDTLALRARPTMDEHNRFDQWRTKWKTYQPRDKDTRTSILRKAIHEAASQRNNMAEFYATTWLRCMAVTLSNPNIRHGYKLAEAFAKNPHAVGHYIAVWFVYEAAQPKCKGLVNPMRAICVELREMENSRRKFVKDASSVGYQEYMTHRCMIHDLEYMLENPGESNGYSFKCCCKCCVREELTDRLKTAHQELDTLLEKQDVKNTLYSRKKYEKAMNTVKELVYSINTNADFELVVSEDSDRIGFVECHGTEEYSRLIVEIVK